MPRQRQTPSFPVRRVLSRIQNASTSPLVVDTPAGRFVAKLRGAAQGPSALVAELVVAELAEQLGLPVPERALLELPPDVDSDDRNDELADLLAASVGQNLGFRWLDAARPLPPAEAGSIDDEFALRVLWLDGLVMNPDRTRANTNVLIARGQPWLIDHGAALGFQYDWADVSEQSPRALSDVALHLFGTRQRRLAEWDAALAPLVTRELLSDVLASVPDSFLAARPAEWTASRARSAYVAFLWKRLKAPRPFLG
jgi:hypothetical protein